MVQDKTADPGIMTFTAFKNKRMLLFQIKKSIIHCVFWFQLRLVNTLRETFQPSKACAFPLQKPQLNLLSAKSQ